MTAGSPERVLSHLYVLVIVPLLADGGSALTSKNINIERITNRHPLVHLYLPFIVFFGLWFYGEGKWSKLGLFLIYLGGTRIRIPGRIVLGYFLDHLYDHRSYTFLSGRLHNSDVAALHVLIYISNAQCRYQ